MASEARVAGGHKANINNLKTSAKSKQHSREVLNSEFSDGDGHQQRRRRPQGHSQESERF
ncbi:hypothetical protein GGR58DRAFT_502489 [Xylaria digitata]|nr:hypothetical protein GGR58DRAFT_502489 [Xylaria digitata]